MTPLNFYHWFGLFMESFPLVPILLGLRKWRKLSLGFRYFLGFLITEFSLNCITNYYIFALHRGNLFLFYFYSFFQSLFILLAFWHFFNKKIERDFTLYFFFFSVILLIFDFMFVSKMDYNYLSNFCINLIISVFSFYYFFTTFPKDKFKKVHSDETELIISAALVLQFFVRTINIFLEKFMLETQNNSFLIIQTRNIYAYFMLLALLIYTYAFYTFKTHEK